MPHGQRAVETDRLLDAAARLLREGGIEAVSTRAVAAAAGTQPPVIYRRFGDKDGLLAAVIVHILHDYIGEMRSVSERSADSVQRLRDLWDLFVEFAFAQPDCIALIYGATRPGEAVSTAADTMRSLIQSAIGRIAGDGRLPMSVDRATALFRSCGVGFVITQLAVPRDARDPELSRIARENALASIMATPQANQTRTTAPARASALRQTLAAEDLPLTPAERALMAEWLDRIADARRH